MWVPRSPCCGARVVDFKHSGCLSGGSLSEVIKWVHVIAKLCHLGNF